MHVVNRCMRTWGIATEQAGAACSLTTEDPEQSVVSIIGIAWQKVSKIRRKRAKKFDMQSSQVQGTTGKAEQGALYSAAVQQAACKVYRAAAQCMQSRTAGVPDARFPRFCEKGNLLVHGFCIGILFHQARTYSLYFVEHLAVLPHRKPRAGMFLDEC